jgi:hypothetical protein
MDTVVQHALPTAWQESFPFLHSQPKLISDAICDIRDALLSFGGKSENREHEGLVVGDGHLVQGPPLASGWKALYRPWPQVHLDPFHRAAETVELVDRSVFQESLVMARDLDPMLSKHFHMLGFKS